MSIVFSSYEVSAVWLCWSSQVSVWKNFCWLWLSMNASCSVPRVIALHILNSMHKVRAAWYLTLSEVLWNSKHIRWNCLLIFNSLLYNDGLGELFFCPLIMKGISSSVQDFLFTITETMIGWVKLPVVVSVLLLTWSEIAMGFSVHILDVLIVVMSCTSGVEHVFGIFESSAWNTEFHSSSLGLSWPIVLSWETLP